MTDKMKLTKTERLILANQYRILEVLDPKEAEGYSNHRIALEDGYALNFSDAFQNIWDELPEEECTFVVDVLSMHRALHFSYQALEDKAGIDETSIKFDGFDGNNESHYMSYCRYFCIRLGRFAELADHGHDGYNSHMPTLDIYRRMLEAWEAMGKPHPMTKDQISDIQMARVHPEHKPGEDDIVQ